MGNVRRNLSPTKALRNSGIIGTVKPQYLVYMSGNTAAFPEAKRCPRKCTVGPTQLDSALLCIGSG